MRRLPCPQSKPNKLLSKLTAGGQISATANSYQKLGTAISGTTAASGSATASVLELGRTISDAPYGIRGMANNLSQLASMFALSTKKAGGLSGAFKAMGSVLKGPLGILLAFQTLIAIVEAFANRSKDLTRNMKELEAEGITSNVMKLHMLRQALQDNTIAMEDKIAALNKAGTEFEDLNGFIEDGVIQMDAFTIAITRMIEEMKEVAFAKAILKETEEVMQDFVKETIKGAETTTGGFKGAGMAVMDVVLGLQVGTVAAKEHAKTISKMSKKYEVLFNMLKAKQQDGSGILLEHLFGKTKKSGSGSAARRFNDQLFDLSAMILKFTREEALMVEKNEREKLNLKQKFEKMDLVRRRDNWIAKQRERLADFLKTKATAAEKSAARATLAAMELQAETEYQEALTAKVILHTTQRNEFQLKLMRKFNNDMMNNRLQMAQDNESLLEFYRDGTSAGTLNNPQSAVGAEDIEGQQAAAIERREREEENFQFDLERKQERLLNEGYTLLETEQLIQADRNNWLVEQTMFEVQLEQDKIEAKRSINQEYVSWVAGLGSILKGIAGENKEIAMAAMVLEKGAAIADVVINTQAANAKITSNMLTEQAGYEASAGLYSAAPPVAAAYMAKSVVAGAKGATRIAKNNIGAGISIAAIAATAFGQKSTGPKGPGGGAAGGGGAAPSREFDFNLVGSTGVNQLAQGVGSKFNEPVQAYVVSSQMTSQQQLDTTIQTQASLGD